MKMDVQSDGKIDVFPEQKIRNSIIEWWSKALEETKNDPFAEKPKANTLYDVLPAIDSLGILESFIIIEQILDVKVPAKFIKSGGYETCEEMLDHLMPQLRAWHLKLRK